MNLPEYNRALKTKSRCYKEYEKAVRKISDEEQEKIKQYIDAIEYCAEEENQQTYLQGIVDSIMILSRMGFLPQDERIKNITQYLK